ncbi:MAG: hypothetical protein ACR2QM_14365 [Longimicrobiales bacterium]
MPRVVFTHSVNDVAHWLSKHSERVEAFASWGSNVVDGVSPDGSNNVSVSVDVRDLEAMQTAMEGPEIEAAKQAHGVLEPISVYVESD